MLGFDVNKYTPASHQSLSNSIRCKFTCNMNDDHFGAPRAPRRPAQVAILNMTSYSLLLFSYSLLFFSYSFRVSCSSLLKIRELSDPIVYELISQDVFITSFCESQFPHKFVNLFFVLVMIKDKLMDFCGN